MSQKKTPTNDYVASQKQLRALKHSFRSIVVIGLMVTFVIIIVAIMIALNNRRIANQSRANIIDDTTQILLDNLDLENECFTDGNCRPGYVCRKPEPQSSIKRCLVCQSQQCPAPARTVRYGKLCLNQSCDDSPQGSTFYSSPTCSDGSFISYDKAVIDNWCRSSNISLEFLIQLRSSDESSRFANTQNNGQIMLTRYDQSSGEEIASQKITLPSGDLINPNPNRTYRFVSVLNADDITQKRNAFKVWVQMPPYINDAGRQISEPWISSARPVIIDPQSTQDSYEIILEY